MRIDNSYLSGLPLWETRAYPGAVPAGEKAEAGPDRLAQTSVHTSSAELVELHQLLQKTADARSTVVDRVASLLRAGAYTTPEAALGTADAILGAAD